MNDCYSQAYILSRVSDGSSTPEDTEQLYKWLNPDERAKTVHAYLWLSCYSSKAYEYIAADLRQSLAKLLTSDIKTESMASKNPTPGVWTIDKDIIFVSAILDNIVCLAPNAHSNSMIFWSANSKLIAAAPDLLAACIQAREAINELIGADYDLAGDLAVLDAAITKAKGLTSE